MGNQAIDIESSNKYILTVLKGPESGKTIYLDVDKQYLLGRESSCDILVDQSDKSVSRKHARLKTTAKTIIIENLSQTNPVLIKGKAIQNFVLKGKGQFQVGNSVYDVRQTGKQGSGTGSGSSSGFKFFFLAVFFILVIALVYFMLSSDTKSPTKQGIPVKSAQNNSGQGQFAIPGKEPGSNILPATGTMVSQQDKDLADEHFRQGMFFYDAGNISRAVEQWGKSISLYPDHPEARTWFLKAERELAEQTKVHYQNAMMHYKYMRYEEAAHKFKIVVRLSRNKNSDIYKDSLRYLDELRKK